MAFIDEILLDAKAGKGGNGVVRWRHEKNKEYGGPSGGDGGRGGDVYARAVRDVHLLSRYRTKKLIEAEDGGSGGSNSLEGKNGEDAEILLPVGSIITNTETKEVFRLDTEEDRVLLLTGGAGGRGNESYKGSRNRNPEQSTPGKEGERGTFHIEVELIADVGLIGMPSAGKSTLLNALTNAHAKTGAYHFTTLEPNLGVFLDYTIADIPGLIEGASEGKGLGHAFLRHIRRTRLLAPLVSLESETPLQEYQDIRKELRSFDPALVEKKEIIILSKADLVTPEYAEDVAKLFSKEGKKILCVSTEDPLSLQKLRDAFVETLSQM